MTRRQGCLNGGRENATPDGEKVEYGAGLDVETNEDFLPLTRAGPVPYLARVAKDFMSATFGVGGTDAQPVAAAFAEQASSEQELGLAGCAARAVEMYRGSSFGKKSGLWRRLTDREVAERFASLAAACGGDEAAALEMMRKCRMLMQLQAGEIEQSMEEWVGHFEGDREDTVATLRKSPNLILSKPSGPVAVTKGLASLAGLFDFGGGRE